MTPVIDTPRRRKSIRGVVREGALLTLAGGSGLLGLLAQLAPTGIAGDNLDLLAKLVTQLGVAGALAFLCWIKHQQVLEKAQELLDQQVRHTRELGDQSARSAQEAERLNTLRIDEAKTFGDSLKALAASQASTNERLLTAVLAKVPARPPAAASKKK